MSKFKFWLPSLIWMALIFAFSSLPATRTSDIHWQDFLIKKTAHFIEYSILAWLLFRSLKHTFGLSLKSLLLLTACLAVIYAVSDEFHQSFVPGREPHLRDVFIDTLGISAACLILLGRNYTPGHVV